VSSAHSGSVISILFSLLAPFLRPGIVSLSRFFRRSAMRFLRDLQKFAHSPQFECSAWHSPPPYGQSRVLLPNLPPRPIFTLLAFSWLLVSPGGTRVPLPPIFSNAFPAVDVGLDLFGGEITHYAACLCVSPSDVLEVPRPRPPSPTV